MRNNQIEGNEQFTQTEDFHGQVTGNASVARGVTLTLYGMVCGNLALAAGAVVNLHGYVIGDVLN